MAKFSNDLATDGDNFAKNPVEDWSGYAIACLIKYQSWKYEFLLISTSRIVYRRTSIGFYSRPISLNGILFLFLSRVCVENSVVLQTFSVDCRGPRLTFWLFEIGFRPVRWLLTSSSKFCFLFSTRFQSYLLHFLSLWHSPALSILYLFWNFSILYYSTSKPVPVKTLSHNVCR